MFEILRFKEVIANIQGARSMEWTLVPYYLTLSFPTSTTLLCAPCYIPCLIPSLLVYMYTTIRTLGNLTYKDTYISYNCDCIRDIKLYMKNVHTSQTRILRKTQKITYSLHI